MSNKGQWYHQYNDSLDKPIPRHRSKFKSSSILHSKSDAYSRYSFRESDDLVLKERDDLYYNSFAKILQNTSENLLRANQFAMKSAISVSESMYQRNSSFPENHLTPSKTLTNEGESDSELDNKNETNITGNIQKENSYISDMHVVFDRLHFLESKFQQLSASKLDCSSIKSLQDQLENNTKFIEELQKDNATLRHKAQLQASTIEFLQFEIENKRGFHHHVEHSLQELEGWKTYIDKAVKNLVQQIQQVQYENADKASMNSEFEKAIEKHLYDCFQHLIPMQSDRPASLNLTSPSACAKHVQRFIWNVDQAVIKQENLLTSLNNEFTKIKEANSFQVDKYMFDEISTNISNCEMKLQMLQGNFTNRLDIVNAAIKDNSVSIKDLIEKSENIDASLSSIKSELDDTFVGVEKSIKSLKQIVHDLHVIEINKIKEDMSKITKVCSKLELKWDPQGQVLKSESSQKERPNDMTAGMQSVHTLELNANEKEGEDDIQSIKSLVDKLACDVEGLQSFYLNHQENQQSISNDVNLLKASTSLLDDISSKILSLETRENSMRCEIESFVKESQSFKVETRKDKNVFEEKLNQLLLSYNELDGKLQNVKEIPTTDIDMEMCKKNTEQLNSIVDGHSSKLNEIMDMYNKSLQEIHHSVGTITSHCGDLDSNVQNLTSEFESYRKAIHNNEAKEINQKQNSIEISNDKVNEFIDIQTLKKNEVVNISKDESVENNPEIKVSELPMFDLLQMKSCEDVSSLIDSLNPTESFDPPKVSTKDRIRERLDNMK